MSSVARSAPRTDTPLAADWSFRQAGRTDWYPAEVPGSVHLDLLRNGLIADPFRRDNEKQLQWIGKVGWEYKATFDAPAGILSRAHVELVFDGLDTYARVSLNGRRIVDADNMYRRWPAAVKGLLKPTGNELVVELRSPILEVSSRMADTGYELPAVNDTGEKTSPYTRKAPYQYGWDWGPRLVTAGVWKPVRLVAWDSVRLVDVAVRQGALTDERAELRAEVEVEGAAAGTARLSVAVEAEGGGNGAAREVTFTAGVSPHSVAFEIPRPRRWWPAGYGEQPLYTIVTRLERDGAIVDERRTRIGLRTLEVRREKDQWGRSFEFVVNGVPVFAKGANWIPADSFPTRVDRTRYEHLLRSARDAHMNMVRVWGGGLYESDVFYDLADELGLLVWQDFHFSCSLYPADDAFLRNVAVEAEEAIRRLRNHPSIALWCGNNEIETAWHQWGWKQRLPGWLWKDYEKLFHDVLPAACAKHDPTRTYWPSSPSALGEAPPGDPGNGDRHYWGVWHAKEPFSAYEAASTRFMSEYGFQSFPEMKTIRAFADAEDLGIESPVMLSHQKNGRGNMLIQDYLLKEYRPPKDFASFLYLSQVQQAEGIKVGAEAHRRARPRTMGSLYWQLDDCWPVASWSSIDYYGRWKALHYYARRFFAPVLLSTSDEDGRLGVWVVSDRREALSGRLTARLLGYDGKSHWERSEDVTVTPLSSRMVLSLEGPEVLGGRDPRTVFLWVELTVGGEVIATNRRFLVPMKEALLPVPRLDVQVSGEGAPFRIRIASDVLARAVRLAFDADDGTFSDNYFDVLPGRPVEVAYRPAKPVTLEALRAGLSIVSLTDSHGPPEAKASTNP